MINFNGLKYLTLLIFPLLIFSQNSEYSGKKISNICDYVIANSFSSNIDAQNALEMVLSVTGSNQRFAIKQCDNIFNAIAIVDNQGVRYILYDKEFLDLVASGNKSKLSILAHEVGHHIYEHTLSEPKTLEESRKWELEADEYSGFVMYKLGATLVEAQQAVSNLGPDFDDTYSTHPTKSKRLQAIENGFIRAKNESYDDLYQHDKLTAQDYFYKAMNSSDPKFQIDMYSMCLQIDPNYSPAAHYNRALANEELENYVAALNGYTETINILGNDTEYFEPFHNRGVIYYEFGEYDNALADFSKVILIDPNNLFSTLGRAATYNKLGNYYDAISDYNKVLKINPEYFDAYYLRAGVHVSIGKYENAIEDYTIAIKSNPLDYEAWVKRGKVYYRMRLYDKASSDANRAIKINSDNPESYFIRAKSYLAIEEWDKAIDDYTILIRISPINNHISYFQRGFAYLKSGQYRKAINDFTDLIKLEPNEAKAYFNRGISKSALGLDACSDNKKACSLGTKIACEWFREDNCD